jgi:RNA polymerase sigma-70 factor (ECF subfamily)
MTTEAAKMSALTWSGLPGIMSGSGDDTGTEPSDETLVAAVARGEERALELLIRRHGGWAARFAERLTGNAAMADEVVQNGFLKIWQKAGTWEGRSRFSTWFYRVLHNLAIDQLRAQRNDHDELDESLHDERAGPQRLAERDQRDARVRAALATLPERQRLALVLSHYEGCSQAEAAAILGIGEGALESLLSRARATLRNALSDERGDIT